MVTGLVELSLKGKTTQTVAAATATMDGSRFLQEDCTEGPDPGKDQARDDG